MIKKQALDEILRKYTQKGLLDLAQQQFGEGLQNDTVPYLVDLSRARLTPQAINYYKSLGLQTVIPIAEQSKGAKKFDPSALPTEFLFYTGFLGTEVAIGVDTSKQGEKVTSLFTRNSEVLKELFKSGAFGDDYTQENLDKDILRMDNKVKTGIEAGSLAFVRLDIIKVMQGGVEYKITVPSKFRSDIGSTLKFYPYGVFPYLADLLKNYIKDSAFSVMQNQADGSIKVRKASLTKKQVEVLYKGYDSDLVESKIKKTICGWDPLNLYVKAYNLESSLYTMGYTTIRLEDIVKISPCSLSEIDRTQYTVNYDNLRGHFKTSIGRWRTDEFLSFRGYDLKDFATNKDRIDALLTWVISVDDVTLYNMMASQPELFGELLERLGERERNTPRAIKSLKMIDLPDDLDERVESLKHMLKTGVVNLTMTTTKSSTLRSVVCTTNPIVLSRMLGSNYIDTYESTRVKMQHLINLLNRGKLETVEAFEAKVYKMGLSAELDLNQIDKDAFARISAANKQRREDIARGLIQSGSSEREAYRDVDRQPGVYSPFVQAVGVIESGISNLREYNRGSNPYLVTYKKVYAESDRDLYGSVDVRNIETVEYRELERK